MVPNSLGPGELLMRFGTKISSSMVAAPCRRPRDSLLRIDQSGGRLRRRVDDHSGVICKGDFEGREVLGLRLNCTSAISRSARRDAARAGLQGL